MIELRYLGVRHFVIEECRRLANGCSVKCGCIGSILFLYLSLCLGAIICDINTIIFMSTRACAVCDALVASCATVHSATPLSMKQNGRSILNEGIIQFINILALI